MRTSALLTSDPGAGATRVRSSGGSVGIPTVVYYLMALCIALPTLSFFAMHSRMLDRQEVLSRNFAVRAVRDARVCVMCGCVFLHMRVSVPLTTPSSRTPTKAPIHARRDDLFRGVDVIFLYPPKQSSCAPTPRKASTHLLVHSPETPPPPFAVCSRRWRS